MGESQPQEWPQEWPAEVSESAYLFIVRDKADDEGRTVFCLSYANDDGMQEVWLTYAAYHRIAAATREGLERAYSRLRVAYEMREEGLKRERTRALVALSKKAPERKKLLGRTDMGALIKAHHFGARLQDGIDRVLQVSYLKIYATDKGELLDQVREYSYAKGVMAGVRDDENGEIAQIGRAADVMTITEDDNGVYTFTVTGDSMFKRSVLTEYKGQDKSDGMFTSTYWDDEVESLEPLFALKFTHLLQLEYFKEALGAAEIAAINGYNEGKGTDQKAHTGGGWPTTTPMSPDGLLMIIYRAVFKDKGKHDAFFGRKKKSGSKGGETNRKTVPKRSRDED